MSTALLARSLALFLLPACTTPCLAPSAGVRPDDAFEARFTGRTMRFDYHHSGTFGEEHFGADRCRVEGDWAGSRAHLVPASDLGGYRARLVDAASGETVWSQGFSSLYGEWETTGEAKKGWKTFHESARFPEPRGEARLVIEKRSPDGAFREMQAFPVDPASRFVDRSAVTPRGEVVAIRESGPPSEKVDLLFVGDGYTAPEKAKLVADARRLADVLLGTEPYRSRQDAFNVRVLFVPAAESGISNPRKGVWRDAPFGCTYNSFDTDRYVLTFANEKLRDAAAQAPYDALVLLLNEKKYGGGGIYNLWATVSADSEQAPYLFVHEFGHSFAGLADEYYSSQVAYEEKHAAGHEPWEPNVTALLDPADVKWKDLVQAGTPLPTPWDQKGYDAIDLEYQAKRKKMIEEKASEESTEALMREVGRTTGPRLAAESFAGKVGAFEGAMYEAKGLYRPEVDCIMFTRNPKTFCRVCARSIEKVIASYAE